MIDALATPRAHARSVDTAAEASPWAEAPELATELARTALVRGLAVTRSDGTTAPIAITATPIVLDDAELRRRQRLAARLASAGLKMSRAVLNDDARAATVLAGLSPLEAQLARETFARVDTLVTTRVDFFGAGAGLRALELNATIPAMQGYSDIAAESLLDVVGRQAGVPRSTILGWQTRNGSNARALFDALLAGYRGARPGRAPSRIGLLCRRQDAQLTELVFLRDRFRTFGVDADVVHPDQLTLDDDAVRVDGKAYDLVYRHLFVRRLEERGMDGADTVTQLLRDAPGKRAVVLNPPASQVEMKSVFALLSESLEDDALAHAAGLDGDELAAIRSAVPWTRLFRGAELVARVKAEPERFVLKRAWDYGGRAVFVGRARASQSFQERVTAAWSDPPAGWDAVCERAAVDARGGGFVVQERVDATPLRYAVAHADGVESLDLYVDFSAYASVGLDVEPRWGAVCRGSTSSIVNIMGGGGVVPVITAEVAREVSAALDALDGALPRRD